MALMELFCITGAHPLVGAGRVWNGQDPCAQVDGQHGLEGADWRH